MVFWTNTKKEHIHTQIYRDFKCYFKYRVEHVYGFALIDIEQTKKKWNWKKITTQNIHTAKGCIIYNKPINFEFVYNSSEFLLSLSRSLSTEKRRRCRCGQIVWIVLGFQTTWTCLGNICILKFTLHQIKNTLWLSFEISCSFYFFRLFEFFLSSCKFCAKRKLHTEETRERERERQIVTFDCVDCIISTRISQQVTFFQTIPKGNFLFPQFQCGCMEISTLHMFFKTKLCVRLLLEKKKQFTRSS